MEALQIIEKFMMALQISPQEMIFYLNAKHNHLSSSPLVGMYCYADGMFSFDVLAGKVISGIVGAIFPMQRKVLCICLEQQLLRWGSRNDYVGTKDLAGKEATILIEKFARRHEYAAPAAEYCLNYDKFGVKAGEAFMFSNDEALEIMKGVKDFINPALLRIKCPILQGCYWCSSEYWDRKAYRISIDVVRKSFCNKIDRRTYVRPVFWRNY